MKRLKTMILAAVLLLTVSIVARGQQPMPQFQPYSLEDDPGYQQLSPERKAYVRATMDRLDRAIAQHDARAVQQIELDLLKVQLAGGNLCGHVVDDATNIDAHVFSADHQQDAFAITWPDPQAGSFVRSAIFTGQQRCVVKDGDVVDGRYITRALPDSLAVSTQHGMVAWIGEYYEGNADNPYGRTIRRAVFVEDHFLFNISPFWWATRSSRPNAGRSDIRWNDEQEIIVPLPGMAVGPIERVAPTTIRVIPPMIRDGIRFPRPAPPVLRPTPPAPPATRPPAANVPAPRNPKPAITCLPYRPCPQAKQ